jgi:hypothetical protein
MGLHGIFHPKDSAQDVGQNALSNLILYCLQRSEWVFRSLARGSH